MDFFKLITITVISVLVGALFTIIDNYNKAENSKFSVFLGILEKSLIYGILGLAITTSIDLIFSVNKIEHTLGTIDKSLTESDRYYKAQNSINDIESDNTRNLFVRGLEQISAQLDDIPKKRLFIPREQIWNVWKTLITESKSEIHATNLVSQEDWRYVSPDASGKDIQDSAMHSRNKIRIKRIFIYDDTKPDYVRGLFRLATIQKDVGIQVKFLLRKNIENNLSVEDDLKNMNGILDIVISDGNSVLLTMIDRDTYTMRGSYLSYDSKQLLASKHFWEVAWDLGSSYEDFKKNILNDKKNTK